MFPGAAPSRILKGPAPAVPLAVPTVERLDDTTGGGVRTLRVRIRSVRQAPNLLLHVDPGAELRGIGVDGRRAAAGGGARGDAAFYHGLTADGVEVTLVVTAARRVSLTVVDQSDGLPPLPGVASPPRPAATMPSPLVAFRDPTFVRTSVTL